MHEAELLSRIQFAVTVGFHFLFPPLSIGLGLALVFMEGMYLRTKNELYEQIAKFWVKVFALIFAVGVATGIVMEFEFGTNWAAYSRFVGDVFGSPLAAEGVFAFFLESCFLGLLVFGWKRISPKMHFFSTIMVALGAHLSAFWIIVANSWQQTPAGFHLVDYQMGAEIFKRAEITDFWAMVFNPSTIDRYFHTLSAAWLTGAFFVISICGYYLLKRRHLEFAKASLKIALLIAFFASLIQLFTGHTSALGITKNQPAKLASLEGHYTSGVADMYLVGWVDEANEKTYGIKIPAMLSLMVNFDPNKPVVGLRDFPKENRPPVNVVFQTYHIMVAIGMLLILISAIGLLLWWRGKLFDTKWFLWASTVAFILPQIANQTGWMTAEIGRQPWIVYGLLRTSEALSKNVQYGQVMFSLIMFSVIYLLLLGLFIFLLLKKIKLGPEIQETV